ncbi:pyridoxal phosphate-dependent aminotransferase [Amycolatopsis albidoflavus]|uniref:Histidinol-phosphate aminotransferase n=4 Tax=Amycolatopsis TaxID=1813 RepID=A0ABW5IAL5_9PSEU
MPEQPRREPAPVPVAHLAQNEGIFGPVAAARRAIAEAAGRGNRYPEAGTGALRRAIGARYGIPAERIVVAAGSTAVIHYLSLCLLGPGDEVVFGHPTFVAYRLETANRGATAVPVPLTEHGSYDLDSLLAAVTPRTKLAYVTNPNNPTGGMVARDEVRAFLDALPAHVLPVIDEAYFDYVEDPGYPDSIKEFCSEDRPVAVLRTFSKIFGLAGLRVGFGVLPAEIAKAARKIQVPYDVNGPAAAAALATLDAPEHEIAERRAATAAGRELLVSRLRALGFAPLPSVANFVQVRVGDARAVAESLAAEGVFVRPLGSWGAPDSIRVTIGPPSEMDRFAEVFGRVARRTPADS